MTVERKTFIGKKCEHEDAELDISYHGGNFEITYGCETCEGHNCYHLEEGKRINNLILEWYDEKPICVECDKTEENCMCEQCIECDSLEYYHYDGKCLLCNEVVDVRVEEE